MPVPHCQVCHALGDVRNRSYLDKLMVLASSLVPGVFEAMPRPTMDQTQSGIGSSSTSKQALNHEAAIKPGTSLPY